MDFAKVFAVALAASALAACHRTSDVPPQASASPSAILIGTKPADPTGDPPGTTPVASNTTTVSKQEEISGKPSEGDDHSHSTLSSASPQKSGGQDGAADRSAS
jgi:hypothetical protein